MRDHLRIVLCFKNSRFVYVFWKCSPSMWQLTLLPSWWHSIVFKDFTSILVGWFSSFSFSTMKKNQMTSARISFCSFFYKVHSWVGSSKVIRFPKLRRAVQRDSPTSDEGASMLVTMIHNLMKTDFIILSTKQDNEKVLENWTKWVLKRI